MLKSELEKILQSLGLKSEVGNSLNTIMSIWREHKNNKYLINGDYYSTAVLGKNDIEELNKPFKQLLDTLIKNKLQIRDVHLTENGAISEIVIYARKDTLSYNEKDIDFEIETNVPTRVYGSKSYNEVIPSEIGFTLKEYSSTDILFDLELSKKEKDKVLENLEDILDNLDLTDSTAWVLQYIETQNEPRIIKYVIENKMLPSKFLIQEILNNEEAFSDNQNIIKLYTEVFKYISTIKCVDIDARTDSDFVGHLPNYVVESLPIFKNILENWEFTYETGQTILDKISIELHTDVYAKRLKLWVATKDPEMYYLDSWDSMESILGYFSFDTKFITTLFENKWLEVEHIASDYLIDFITTESESMKQFSSEHQPKILKSLAYIINEVFKHYNVEKLNKILKKILIASSKRSYDYSIALKPFIDKFKGLDFKIADGEIIKYLKDKDPLKQKLLSDSDYISYLIAMKKEEYLPQNVTDIFLF